MKTIVATVVAVVASAGWLYSSQQLASQSQRCDQLRADVEQLRHEVHRAADGVAYYSRDIDDFMVQSRRKPDDNPFSDSFARLQNDTTQACETMDRVAKSVEAL